MVGSAPCAEWDEGEGVIIEVCDNGPGIPPDELPMVFERGYRGRDVREGKIPGSGLGLSIAMKSVRNMGGKLKISNRVDTHGIQASFFFPRSPLTSSPIKR